MGANHQHEIASLCKIAEPTHGLITNIGRAHLGGFGGFEGVIKAKNELYQWLRDSDGKAIVNADNPLLMELTQDIKRTLYGSSPGLFVSGKPIMNDSLLTIEWSSGNNTLQISTNLVGNYNFENVMAAICLGTYFNVPSDKIQKAIATYFPSNSRSQAIQTGRNSVIMDAYNANPTSMGIAIENFSIIEAAHKMIIIGDMLELGEESLAEHRSIINKVARLGFDKVLLVGPDFTKVANNEYLCFSTSEDAYLWLESQCFSDYTILIKGSRGIKMEKVLPAL